MNDPDAGRSLTTYNQNGQVSDTIDAAQTQLLYRYDRLGRLIDVFNNADLANGHRWAHYAYDDATTVGGIGNLDYVHSYDPTSASPTSPQTRTETTAYDTTGRPTTQQVTVYAANSPAVTGDEALDDTYAFTTSWTRTGAVYQTTHPGVTGSNLTAAETVTTGYNTLGMPVRISGVIGASTYWYTHSVAYDSVARPVQTVLGPPGSQAGLILDTYYQGSDGRLSRLDALVGNANVDGTVTTSERLQTDTYRYDAPGNPMQVTHITQWDSEVECFDYDQRQRLVEAYTLSYPETCPYPTEPHGSGGPTPYADTWAINNIGNITSFDGAARTHGETASGCLTGTQTNKPHALSTHGSDTFAYNCNGAITQHVDGADTTTYTWDQRQRLQTAASSATGTTTNVYDATNNRALRTDPDGTKTVYLGTTEIRYTPGSPATIQVARTYGQTRREYSGDLTFYSTNHQGSITATNGNLGAARIRYQPYGGPRTGLTGSTTDLDDRNFLGQTDDPASQTVYLNNRHYLPGTGTFISVDPLARPTQPRTLNPYVYARVNPVGLSDPTGLDPDTSAIVRNRAERNGKCTYSTWAGGGVCGSDLTFYGYPRAPLRPSDNGQALGHLQNSVDREYNDHFATRILQAPVNASAGPDAEENSYTYEVSGPGYSGDTSLWSVFRVLVGPLLGYLGTEGVTGEAGGTNMVDAVAAESLLIWAGPYQVDACGTSAEGATIFSAAVERLPTFEPASAVTYGHFILYDVDSSWATADADGTYSLDERLVRHEMVHVHQWEVGGDGFALYYLFDGGQFESEAYSVGPCVDGRPCAPPPFGVD